MSVDDLSKYTSPADEYATRSPQARQAGPHQRPPRPGRRVVVTVALAATVLAGSAAGGLYYLDRTYDGKIYPNVSVQGQNLGEMNRDQASAALRAYYAPFLAAPATISFGGQTWTPTAADLGISVNIASAIDEAYSAGRNNGLVANLQQVKHIWDNGYEIPVAMTIDQDTMRAYIEQIASEFEVAPVDASVTLNGTTVQVTPAQIGRQVLIDDTVADLTSAIATMQPEQDVAIRTRDIQPRLSDAAAETARAELAAILQPISITADGKTYDWTPELIAPMLDIARVPADDATDRVQIDVNRSLVATRMAAIADDIGRGSVNPRVAWNGGDLKIIRPGQAGLRLNEDAATAQVIAQLRAPERTLALPVEEVAPQVTEANLRQLGINELVSVGRSDFSGSADYRITNIGVGMDILNGILLAPGEEFSFNKNIGEIDARNGFVEGYAIIQNRTQLEFGGGICQDSTTIFRAAFWAGLPITERWGHTFYISWYDKYALGPLGSGPGMDATIFTGGPDLRFVNDTGNWLLIQSYSNPTTGLAEVAFYGTKVNRTVGIEHEIVERTPAITEPVYIPDPKQERGSMKQTDTARGGMKINVFRTITNGDGTTERQRFQTVFKPWADKFTVNPADVGRDGKPVFLNRPAPQPTPAPAPAAQPAPAPAEQPAEQPAPAPTEQPAPSNG